MNGIVVWCDEVFKDILYEGERIIWNRYWKV